MIPASIETIELRVEPAASLRLRREPEERRADCMAVVRPIEYRITTSPNPRARAAPESIQRHV